MVKKQEDVQPAEDGNVNPTKNKIIMIPKTFTGIGSRATPKSLIPKIEELCEELTDLNFVLRSGGAMGADSFWEEAYDKFGGTKQIYLPWQGFNDNLSDLFKVSENALKLAEKYHPNWNRVGQKARLLLGRNSHEVLGRKLIHPSSFVICWTPNGQIIGGTGQAIRLAQDFRIPIYNLALESDILKLDNRISCLKLENVFA